VVDIGPELIAGGVEGERTSVASLQTDETRRGDPEVVTLDFYGLHGLKVQAGILLTLAAVCVGSLALHKERFFLMFMPILLVYYLTSLFMVTTIRIHFAVLLLAAITTLASAQNCGQFIPRR
jgi:hypothetical protein